MPSSLLTPYSVSGTEVDGVFFVFSLPPLPSDDACEVVLVLLR